PATGMAEVSLTFQNDGRLVPPQYAGFGEITVTRRLFRNGDSDYEINKAACRLLDITELFLGTGVGTRAYSIIEQGRIGLIVSAKPEDRRAIIEEAAGVTKYKARRKQAERKLDQAAEAEKVVLAHAARLEAGLSAERLQLLEDEKKVQELAEHSHRIDKQLRLSEQEVEFRKRERETIAARQVQHEEEVSLL